MNKTYIPFSKYSIEVPEGFEFYDTSLHLGHPRAWFLREGSDPGDPSIPDDDIWGCDIPPDIAEQTVGCEQRWRDTTNRFWLNQWPWHFVIKTKAWTGGEQSEDTTLRTINSPSEYVVKEQ